jgi:drug/metabolite transporter (DMT)-like permease
MRLSSRTGCSTRPWRISSFRPSTKYQGALTAAVSLALYGRAISILGASNAAVFIALGPIMAALMAIPALGEWPFPTDWVAIFLVATGVYLSSGGPLPHWRRNA